MLRNKNKIIHLIHDKPFHSKNNEWQNQAEQREYIFNGLKLADEDDYIMFSDPDEIPNPITLRNLNYKPPKRWIMCVPETLWTNPC